ncbi:MAG: Rrf2 family transcriptional regulator, partial [Bacteroidales bacterium]|nr:Rrf2 family transcriptional regulator [Bacteroidales bacterium]
MNFSKTAEYALRIMSFMAMDEKRLYSSKEIFQNLNIPFRYLRKLLIVLSKGGLINRVQETNGIYRVSRNLSEIYLLNIIYASGGYQCKNECFFGFQN